MDHIGRDIVEYGRTVILGILSASYRDATVKSVHGLSARAATHQAGHVESLARLAARRRRPEHEARMARQWLPLSERIGYFGCWLIDMTYAVTCQISSSVITSRHAGMRRPLFSRPSAIDWKTPLGSSSRRARLMPPLPSAP